jgi:hypothetical protein
VGRQSEIVIRLGSKSLRLCHAGRLVGASGHPTGLTELGHGSDHGMFFGGRNFQHRLRKASRGYLTPRELARAGARGVARQRNIARSYAGPAGLVKRASLLPKNPLNGTRGASSTYCLNLRPA